MKLNQKQSYYLLAGGFLGIAASVLSTPVLAQATATPAPAPSDIKTPAPVAPAKSTPAPLPTINAAPGTPEEIAQLRELVNALTSRLQSLETDQKKTSEAVTKNVSLVSSKEKLAISGLLQVQSLNYFGQDGPGPRARAR